VLGEVGLSPLTAFKPLEMRGSGRGNLREVSAQNNKVRILPHNAPATLSANLPTGWWRRRPERRSFVCAWRSLKRPSPRCGRNWQKSGASGKRPSGSATNYVENCTHSQSRERLPNLPRNSRVGVSPTPLREELAKLRAHSDSPGGGSGGRPSPDHMRWGFLCRVSECVALHT
jgi:hypothetical protein